MRDACVSIGRRIFKVTGRQAPLQIALVTLFPAMVRGALGFGVLGRALERGLASVECVDPRSFADDPHKTVDDRPYGGGPGMVGTPPPWAAAIDAATGQLPAGVPRVHLSAQGRDRKSVV